MMRIKLRIVLVAAVLAAPVIVKAQQAGIDPVGVSPDKYKVLLENERARVVEYSIKPGEKDNAHTHPPKVSYVLNGGTLRITLDTSSFTSVDTTGQVTWMGAVPLHVATNIGNTPVRIVLVEVKRVESSRVAPAEDPAQVNPASIKVRLENDSVRVMEAVLPPGFQEKPHSHTPYVMYVLSGGKARIHAPDGQAREFEFKAGDVFFSEPVTHWAENIGSTTIKILIVEIRHR